MLRKIRAILAIIFFVSVTLLFLDFTGGWHTWMGWMAKIQFLNLGNLIVCPAQNCLIIFKYKTLVRIAALTNT